MRPDDPQPAPTPGTTPEPHPDRSARRIARIGALGGVLGPLMLVAYFGIPAFVTLPSVAAPAEQVIQFADRHARLFYLAGWLQVTGALLSTVFFLVLIHLTASIRRLSGITALAGSTLLLGVVAIEAMLLEAVPMVAADGDRPAVSVTYALANDGVFARIFPLAPASLVFAGLGLILLESRLLHPAFARSALVIAALFLLAGAAAVTGQPGVVFAIVMSVVEAVWIPAAAVALARWRPR